MDDHVTAEEQRLEQARRRETDWLRWGPYLAEREWGAVREDYSASGDAWNYFPHEHARSRAYRWGEDGIAGISDRRQLLCFAWAFWNGRDPFLKERLFGLSNPEGNHGEDVKEYYFYLDSTPTHSYMKFLYKYPQAEFPYARLVEESRRRSVYEPEFELLDTGVFDEGRYFDIFIEYAKVSAEELLVRAVVHNRGLEEADIHLLPTLWFRNTWSWPPNAHRPVLKAAETSGMAAVQAEHPELGARFLACHGSPVLLFAENETNNKKLFGAPNATTYVKDGIHECVVAGCADAVNPDLHGTKCAAHYHFRIGSGDSVSVRLRLGGPPAGDSFDAAFDALFEQRLREADEFYAPRLARGASDELRSIQRQAFAGLMWTKQFYHYDVRTWLEGDSSQPPPPPERRRGRNSQWTHLYNDEILSMPDKWEFPWYAAWDLAFHCVAMAPIDPDFAKQQLVLLLREWYMHPNGQLPAYEWAFDDVNPPVHAWACWRVYRIEKRIRGSADRRFLEETFHKLLLNFTWWVNRKDPAGRNVFQGGFLGMDNIGVFDRSQTPPTGGLIEQSDATSWMAMFCLNMLAIAKELALDNPAYEGVASKFFEHFIHIAHATHDLGGEGVELWNEEDGFYYDVLHLPDGTYRPIQLRSMVGLAPLFAVETIEPEIVEHLPDFARRMQWFLDNHPDAPTHIDMSRRTERGVHRLLAIAPRGRLLRLLRYVLDENEFLSPFGIRSLSKIHQEQPYILRSSGQEYRVEYEPGESSCSLFGGNSNWRGPIWFPVNFLLIEALQKYHHYYGDELKAECPAGSGQWLTLWEVAAEISRRLIRIFVPDERGQRPVYGAIETLQRDPHWRDHILFHEYFHADTGAGLGASHQTGWTGLVAKLIEQTPV
jgi:hypothetical protein